MKNKNNYNRRARRPIKVFTKTQKRHNKIIEAPLRKIWWGRHAAFTPILFGSNRRFEISIVGCRRGLSQVAPPVYTIPARIACPAPPAPAT